MLQDRSHLSMHEHIRIPPDRRREVRVKGKVKAVVRDGVVSTSQLIVHLRPTDGHVLGSLQRAKELQ